MVYRLTTFLGWKTKFFKTTLLIKFNKPGSYTHQIHLSKFLPENWKQGVDASDFKDRSLFLLHGGEPVKYGGGP